ncbi:hypothetical protein Tco_0707896, partial [Tanacetum coccineum]
PKFNGILDSVASARCLSAVEGAFRTSCCKENNKVNFASNFLRNNAKMWWDGKGCENGEEWIGSCTWKEFKELLMPNLLRPKKLIKSKKSSKLLCQPMRRGGSIVKIGGRGGSISGMGGGSLVKRSMKSNDGLGGVENKSSVGSKLMASREECLDGWVGGGKGEVKGGGVVFGVSRIEFGMILEDNMGKVVVKHSNLMEEPIDNRWVVREDDKKGTPVEGWRSNTDEH